MALTIRTDKPEVQELLQRTKDATNQNSSSKALLEAARIVVDDVPRLKERIKQLEAQLIAEKDKNEEIIDLVSERQTALNKIDEVDRNLSAIISHG